MWRDDGDECCCDRRTCNGKDELLLKARDRAEVKHGTLHCQLSTNHRNNHHLSREDDLCSDPAAQLSTHKKLLRGISLAVGHGWLETTTDAESTVPFGGSILARSRASAFGV
jgi:hypothetical protein